MRRGVAFVVLAIGVLALRAYGRPLTPQVVRAHAPTAVTTAEARGRLVFEKYGCRMCHGQDGKGGMANPNAQGGGKIPSLAIEYAAEGYTPAELRKLISNGTVRIDREDASGPVPPYRMPGWSGQITDRELDDVVHYLLSLDPKPARQQWR